MVQLIAGVETEGGDGCGEVTAEFDKNKQV